MEGEQQEVQHKENRLYQIILVIGIIFIAFNLRPAITSVGPLLGEIRDDLSLSHWSAGLITSLPLVAFAVISPIAPRLGNRLTYEKALMIGLIVLAFGIGIRSVPIVALLFLGTLLVGIGIAICNVLLPGVIKDKFPLKVGLMTSIYTTAMGIVAATASGLSIPLSSGMNMGWQLALLIWSTPAIIGIFIWFYLVPKRKDKNNIDMAYVRTTNNKMSRSPLAWQVAIFMGLQSFLFYVTISWLPEILHDYGISLDTAGWMLSFMQFIGLPVSFLVPVIAEKLSSQRLIVVILGLLSISGFSGLVFGTSYVVMVISIILIGFALSGHFALALAFLGLRAKTARQAANLSGMAQSIGYVLAAIGPMLIGYLFDLTNVWTVPLVTLIGVSVIVMIFGLGAGRNKYVFEK